MARQLRVSRSGYYAWQKRPESSRSREGRRLMLEIRAIHEESRRSYGSPRVYAELGMRGYQVGRKRVALLMRKAEIQARRKRRFRKTTDSNHRFPVAANALARDFAAPAPNHKWVADITYVWTREGWLYLAVILDLFSRYVVGWATDSHIDGELARKALRMALAGRSVAPGLLHHSDRGVQYACDRYQSDLLSHRISCSMSRKGDCWDNAAAESFFGTLKSELINNADYFTRSEASSDVFQYIAFYNRKRRHSSLNYLSPAEYEKLHYAKPDRLNEPVH